VLIMTCRSRSSTFLLVLAIIAAGCSHPKPVVPPTVNLAGYSQAFKDGFAAGCKTARGTATKDEARMRSDTDYKIGWEDGTSICAKR
jgi:hypothetical protein